MSKLSDYDIPAVKHDFFTDLKFGKKGEKLVSEFIEAMQAGAFEVKTDRYRNGRMVLETEQNPRRRVNELGEVHWQPSGLMVTKATWWVYVYTLDGTSGGAFLIISVARIKRYLKKNKDRFNKKTLTKFAWQSGNPCKGYLLMPEDVQDLMVNPDYDEV